jgi:hypothetical protein
MTAPDPASRAPADVFRHYVGDVVCGAGRLLGGWVL